jgi:putative transposase
VDRRGRLLKLLVTAGQCGDAPQAESLLEELQPGTVAHVIVDAAYDSDAIRQRVQRLRAKSCIWPNPICKRKPRSPRDRDKNRNMIERVFGRIKRCRRVATRYEKKSAKFAGFIWLAALLMDF